MAFDATKVKITNREDIVINPATEETQEEVKDILQNISISGIGGGIPANKATDAYSYQVTSETASYVYWFFEDGVGNWYIRRKNKTTGVHDFSKGIGGYESVFVNNTSAPSGSHTWGTYDETFTNVGASSLEFEDGALKVVIQDQISEPIDLYFCQKYLTTSPSSGIALDARSINVTNVTGVTAGDCMDISENGRNFQALIQNVATNTITFNCPSDQAFTTSAVIKFGKWNMNVNGSTTPIIYVIQPPAGVSWDINRIIIGITDDSPMDDGKFGGITALTNGVVFRVKDGYYKNLFVVNDNSGWRERSFDITYADKAPAGLYGFGCRKTFNGQEKSGVTIRLNGDTNDQLQVIIQDNLSALTKFAVVAQGHTVNN